MLLLCVLGMNDDVSMYGIYIYQVGGTALIEASGNGHREVVQLLLEHGADPQQTNKVSHTPLPLPPLPFPPPSPTPVAIIIVTRVRLYKLS